MSSLLYRSLVASIAIVVVACAGGVPAPEMAEDRTLDRAERLALQERAERFFASGWMSKPRREHEEEPAFAMAPLLIHEVGDTSDPPRLGAVRADRQGGFGVDVADPTVYYRLDRGEPYPEWSFEWWYEPAEATATPVRRGVRITLDGEGLPFVWELLGDSSGARLLFVSEDLESDACRQHGPALGGRTFCAERPVEETPEVVVARAIESGTTPLGPFVYVGAGPQRDVTTLICRCMASQVGEIRGEREYRLAPRESIEHAVGAPIESRSLTKLLRLPR